MALEFELSIQTSLNANEVTELMLKETDFMRSKKGKNDGDFYGLGFICWISLIDELGQDITLETHSVKTNLSLWFWHDNDNYKEGLRNILKAVILVLQNTSGDAVFESIGGSANLLRINGRLALSPTSFFEDEEAMWRFKDIPFEYEVKDLNMD
jgi:hypothetical protein